MRVFISIKKHSRWIIAAMLIVTFLAGMFSYPYIREVYQHFASSLNETDGYIFYNALSPPFKVDGFAFMDQNGGCLNRLIANKHYSEGVNLYAKNTAGGRIRFSTDSPSFCIQIDISDAITMPYHTEYGSSGLDVYIYNNERKVWLKTIVPGSDDIISIDESTQTINTYIVTLPQYACVDHIQIGIEKGYEIAAPQYNYDIEKPFIFYGSSITQGAAASRTGTSFPFLIAEYFNADYLNFGFSGSAKGESCLAEDIASLQMSAFIMEYDHNADTVKDLEATHYDFYKIIRDAHPNIPIVMISRVSGGYSISEEETQQRVDVIEQTYRRAVSSGDDNIIFINGSLLRDTYGADQMLADGKHPNDYGMKIIAEAVIEKLEDFEFERVQ